MSKIIETISNNLLIGYLVLALIMLPIAGKNSLVYAQSFDDCEKELAEAQKKYDSGKFDDAIELLQQCLSQENLSQDVKMKTYRLLGLTYIAKDYLKEAKTAVSKLLDIVPNYQADPEQDPPTFVNIIADEIEERKSAELKVEDQIADTSPEQKKQVETEEEEGTSIWWYIAGGAVAIAVVVVLLLGGGDPPPSEDDDLPGPPDLP